MPIVEVEGQQFNFPEGTSDEVIGNAIRQHFSTQAEIDGQVQPAQQIEQQVDQRVAGQPSPPIPTQLQGADRAVVDGQVEIEAETQRRMQQQPEGISPAGQAILDVPGGAAISEFASAVNRGAVNLLDFLGPEQINAALQLAGSEARVPTLGEQPIVQEAITGEFMEPGLARQAVRTAGEFVAPTGAVGATIRGAAAQIPKVAPVAQTVTQRITQAAATPALPEAIAGATAGAGSEVGAKIGEEIGGEEGQRVGRLIGGVLAPISGAVVKESAKLLISKSAKKLLNEAAPTIEGLKTAARGVFKEIDDLGVTVNPGSTARLSGQLGQLVRKQGFNPTIHPKVNAALKEFDAVAGKPQTLSEVDVLRRVANAAARSTEPDEARLGNLMINKIDDFLDTAGRKELSGATQNIGAKYRDARQLWRRAKKSEQIEEAFGKAQLQATGFENGIRTQFRSILNNKKARKGFTKEELDAMRQVVKGGTLENIAKMIGRFGFSEGQASNMLMGSLGVAGGAAIGGPAGAVAVPLIGQMSRSLAQKLTRKGAEGADLIVKAGNNGINVVKAYMKAVPPKERTAQELTELLLRPDISLQGLKNAARNAPQKQKRLINDAAFLVNAIKSTQQEQQ